MPARSQTTSARGWPALPGLHGPPGTGKSLLARAVCRSQINLDENEVPPGVLEKLEVDHGDVLNALKRIQPSALREIMIQVPEVVWDDIGGLSEVKEQLREGIKIPITDPDAFRNPGIRAPKGFLFFGHPGTGTTLLGKAVAHESEANSTIWRAEPGAIPARTYRLHCSTVSG